MISNEFWFNKIKILYIKGQITKLDNFVKSGKITQAQADDIIASAQK